MPGLHNGGRPGKRSGPPAGFIDGIHYSTLLINPTLRAIYVWSAILTVYKRSNTIEEATEFLQMLGILEDVKTYQESARVAYQSSDYKGPKQPT